MYEGRLISLQLMSGLLHSLLISSRFLARLQPFLDVAPRFPFCSELSGQDELRTECHHDVRGSHAVTDQEFPAAFTQLSVEVVHILLHVARQPSLSLFGVARLLEPPHVEDSEAVQGEGRFGCMDPLEDLVSLRFSDPGKDAVGGVVFVA